jgi:hypothetical protein
MPKLDQVVERLPPAYVKHRRINNDCATLVFVVLLGLAAVSFRVSKSKER